MNIWDEIRLDEERRAEQERALIAAEMAAWRALPQAEQERISAERNAKLDALFGAEDSGDDEGDDEGDDDEG